MELPPDFISRTKLLLGDEYALLEKALQEEPPVSIRINPAKQIALHDGYAQVGWCETGYYLPDRPSFTFDPLFHAGCYYVQEASSMFLEQVVRQHISTPVVCLDLCAAPGGKSTHLASVLPVNSLLVSNEVIQSRADVLKENLFKWGFPNTVVTCNDPHQIGQLTHLFDVIVADLPCSGEGMFRKDRKSRNEWSVDNVRLCAARQRRIIQDVWDSLKPRGLFIYSTCTFNREENEENIRYIVEHLGAEVLPVFIRDEWKISPAIKESFPLYRFYPYRVKGEGFCLALLRKPDGVRQTIQNQGSTFNDRDVPYASAQAEVESSRFNVQGSTFNAQSSLSFLRSLSDADSFHFEFNQQIIRAIPISYQYTCRLLSRHLRVLSAGVFVGEIKGKDIVPSPALALSTCFRNEAFPSVELTLEESIKYLQKEILVLPEHSPTGYVVVKYKNIPLGFVKNIGNRANNLYPKEWRIRRRP